MNFSVPPSTVSSAPTVWRAHRAAAPGFASAPPAPAALGPDWQPLQQAWRTSGKEPAFQPGWARITWQDTALCYDVLFTGARPRNRARRLNESTWELGDVCEIFLQGPGPGDPGYVELHVTPENQRLQLRWTPDGLGRVRSGELPIEQFMVADPDWVESNVHVGLTSWFVQVVLPVPRLGLRPLAAGARLRTAVCRYDCGDKSDPVLSSTAALQAPSYHRRQDWHELVLVD